MIKEKVGKHPLNEMPGRYQEVYTFLIESINLRKLSLMYDLIPSVASVQEFALPIVIAFNLMKIVAAIMLMNGER